MYPQRNKSWPPWLGEFLFPSLKLYTLQFQGRTVSFRDVYSLLYLVGGFNPLKNISQIANLPQVGVKIKNI